MAAVTASDLAELTDVITNLYEKVDDIQAQQKASNEGVKKVLDEWSQVNLALMDCLKGQTSITQTHLEQQQEHATHLLTLGKSAMSLNESSETLDESLGSLTEYLETNQADQLNDLSQHNQKLQKSTDSLVSYLKGEQSKRLKILENGLGSLINLMEQIPGIETIRTKKRGWNFDCMQSLSSISLCSLFTAGLVLGVFQVSAGEKLVRVDERATWTILKLEKIEDVLGIRRDP